MLKNQVIYRIEDEPTLDMNNSTPRVPILKLSFSGGSYEPNTPKKYTMAKKYEAYLCPISKISCLQKAKHQRYMTLNINISTHSGPILKQSLSGSRYASNTTEKYTLAKNIRSWVAIITYFCKDYKNQPYVTFNRNSSTCSGPIAKQSFSRGNYEPKRPKNSLWQKIPGLGQAL